MIATNYAGLDELDIKLIMELEVNARQTYNTISNHLNIGRSAVAVRVQRLIDNKIIKMICWADPIALGYKLVVSFGISTQPGQIYAVANRLAACPPVLGVYLCSGRFDIIAMALFRSNEEITGFLSNELGSVTGILQIDKTIILRELKVSSRLLNTEKETHKLRKNIRDLDDLDISLIRELQLNPRQRPTFLARKFGLYESIIRRRMQRLIDENIIRIRAVADPVALGYGYGAFIGLKCNPDKIREVAEAIASYNNVQYVVICVGRFDIHTHYVFKKLSDLEHFITVELGSIPGIVYTDTAVVHNVVKTIFQVPA